MQIERYGRIGEMMNWVDETGCVSFAELCRYARSERRDWFHLLVKARVTIVMMRYIRGAYLRRQTASR